MEISTRCGQDSDCNPSSAAGVLGVMLGYKLIPEQFKSAIPSLADKKFSYTDYSYNDIVRSTESRALKVIEKAGGKVTDDEVIVKTQQPKAPKLEQWSPGVPERRIAVTDAAFSFIGDWAENRGAKVSRAKGNEMILKFNGVAVALLGPLSQDGGRAEVFLDGRKVGEGDSYIVPNTHDNVLWNVYDLKNGPHTLRLVTTDSADSRSNGKRVGISGAVVYIPAGK
jgi:hypothetical protein